MHPDTHTPALPPKTASREPLLALPLWLCSLEGGGLAMGSLLLGGFSQQS